MIPVTLAQLAKDCDGQVVGAPTTLISDLSTDTRTVTPGAIFAAIKGARVDGATLAGQALADGASAILTSDPVTAVACGAKPEDIVVVDDVQSAIGKLARANLARVRESGNPDLKVVAITGSVGKTTTKDLLAAILAERGPIIAPPGSFNNELGLPLTVLRADDRTATLVLEMGADRIGNIDYLTSIAPPDVSAVLIVARAHLGEFGGIENVALAKSELVSGTVPGGSVILNADDPRVSAMADLARGPVVTFSRLGAKDADVAAREIRVDETGRAEFTLVTAEAEAPVSLRLVGEHHVANALAAAAVSLSLGVDLTHIVDVLSSVGPASPHRMDVQSVRGITIIDDAYNGNPDSMRAGIAALARLGKDRRRIAVLGAMLELGEASDAEHAALAPVLREAGVAAVVCVGEGVEALSLAASDEGIDVIEAANPDEALELLDNLFVTGDVVLFKGSNGSGVWRIADALVGEED
ncbi:UDP-N-acetylmuramoyl-tripeptide--D-alanyl-D-alanine ligase [Actinomycetaceae bacterium L2_0104]